MGRPLYNPLRAGRGGGLSWYGDWVAWSELRERGAALRPSIDPRGAYVVDPGAGPAAFAAFFAVASYDETVLLWADPARVGVPSVPVAEGLFRIARPEAAPEGRPLWGVMTSGTSGAAKMPVGYADTLELAALHYETAVFRAALPGGVDTLATCLPLQFSAALFMAVLPAVFTGRDLLVFPPHDWRPVAEAAGRGGVLCQSAPAITAAGALSLPEPVELDRLAVLMGGGYLSATRVAAIRERLRGAVLGNIYGTAETGALCVDWNPGEAGHVGRPIAGKPVWVESPDEHGVGLVATTGPDCRRFTWSPGAPLMAMDEVVSGIDYGHFSADGHLYLDGRVDGGEKLHGLLVYPRQIERHILRMPGVADVRVFVARREDGAERLTARVVGDATEGEIRAYCQALPEIQRPADIQCVPEREALSVYTSHGKL